MRLINRKSKKWWHDVIEFSGISLEGIIANACIIYKETCHEEPATQKQFRLSVIAGLIGTSSCLNPLWKKSQNKQTKKSGPYIAPDIWYYKVSRMPDREPSRRCLLSCDDAYWSL